MSDTEPIQFRPHGEPAAARYAVTPVRAAPVQPIPQIVRFDRKELDQILRLYGRMVAAGEWRDYAIDMLKEQAVFSIYRRSSEYPIYRVVKEPRLTRKQGLYSVVATTGLIMKRGQDLTRVIRVLDKTLKPVDQSSALFP